MEIAVSTEILKTKCKVVRKIRINKMLIQSVKVAAMMNHHHMKVVRVRNRAVQKTMKPKREKKMKTVNGRTNLTRV